MSLEPILVLVVGIVSMLFISANWEHWFDPGWTFPLRLALFAFAGACSGFLTVYLIGSTLTAIGGVF